MSIAFYHLSRSKRFFLQDGEGKNVDGCRNNSVAVRFSGQFILLDKS